MLLSMRWAKRSIKRFGNQSRNYIFGIQQGLFNQELRFQSSQMLVDLDFDGYAIGGLAVGEGQQKMFEVLDYAPSFLPNDKPLLSHGSGKARGHCWWVIRGS